MHLHLLTVLALIALAPAFPSPSESLSDLFKIPISDTNPTIPGSLSRNSSSPNVLAGAIKCFKVPAELSPPQAPFAESDALTLFWYLLTRPNAMSVVDWDTEGSLRFPVIYQQGTAYIGLHAVHGSAHARFQEVLIARLAALILLNCPTRASGYSSGGKVLFGDSDEDEFEVVLYGRLREAAATNVTTS